MKKILPLLLLLALLLALAGCKSAAPTPPAAPAAAEPAVETPAEPAAPGPAAETPTPKADTYRRISMQEAVEMMEKETGYVILDVRTRQEYDSGHIPGAILIPNETIGTDELPELPDKDQLILVYCRSGNRSRQASDKLVKLGYTNVVEFGGINSWPGEVVAG
ncbi:MAG: rhodanese-like domain-containing protein [Bacillota bacterium]|nr:rhodanese-like domain-containing protein [Bacillota bacterium]